MTEIDKDIDLLIIRYANGTLTDGDAIYLAEWVSQSPQNAAYFRRMVRKMEENGTTTTDAAAFWQRFAQDRRKGAAVLEPVATPAVARRSMRSIWMGMAAAAAVCVVSADVYMLLQRRSQFSDDASRTAVAAIEKRETVYAAPIGERLTAYLPDSTKVVLNSGAKLTLDADFGRTKRRVSLDGEAYFDVTKNPSRPFVVECGNNEYVVRGTSFNIVSYASDRYSIVTLHTGCLEARVKEDVIVLNPGDELRIDDLSGQITKQSVAVADSTEWIDDGSLSFSEYPLKFVANRLAHRYNVKINIHCSIENILYDGRIDDESLEEALTLLTVTSPVPLSVTEFDGEYYVSKRATVKKR